MGVRKAIQDYKRNVDLSINSMKPFKMLRCSKTCGCVSGIEWDDIKFDPPFLRVKNGYTYTLSMALSNQLENMWQKRYDINFIEDK